MSIRVLQVVSHLGHEGAGQQVQLLALELPQASIEISVCTLSCCPARRLQVEQHGVPVAVLARQSDVSQRDSAARPSWSSLANFWNLIRHIRNVSPHVVQLWATGVGSSHRDFRFARMAALIAQRVPNSGLSFKSVCNVWSFEPRSLHQSNGARRNATNERWIDRKLDLWTDCLIQPGLSPTSLSDEDPLSRRALRRNPQFASPQRTPVPYGVQGLTTQNWSQRHELLRSAALPPDTKLIVAYSSYAPGSRFKDAIWTADLLKVIRDDTHLVLVGSGPLNWRSERFRNQVEIHDRVHLVRDCCQWEHWIPYARCFWDVDGDADSLPFTAAAMANGIPIIAADTHASRALLGNDGAMFFAPGHRGGLARHCQELLENSDLATQYGDRGRERAHKHLNVCQMVSHFTSIYEDLSRQRSET